MGGARLKIHDSLPGYEENRLVRTKTFSAHNKPKFTMMCAKWAFFLRTPEVEQHGEHRVFPLPPFRVCSCWTKSSRRKTK